MKLGANDIDNFAIGADDVDAIYLGDDNVWGAYDGAPSPLIITATGDYIAGVDFPSNTELSVCVVAGGGGGSGWSFTGGGGYRGEIVQDTIRMSSGAIRMTIGNGGFSGNTNNAGHEGEDSSIGDIIIASGGAGGAIDDSGYDGAGAEYVSPCNGVTYTDGISPSGFYKGGQAGAYGNGANGATNTVHPAPASDNSGAGGGQTGGENGAKSGGSGQIVISWD